MLIQNFLKGFTVIALSVGLTSMAEAKASKGKKAAAEYMQAGKKSSKVTKSKSSQKREVASTKDKDKKKKKSKKTAKASKKKKTQQY